MKIIWSAGHIGPMNVDYLCEVIRRAAAAGVDGVELGGHATDLHSYVPFDTIPALQPAVDREVFTRRHADLLRIAELAKHHGLRLGVWQHEISGPDNLLDLLPALRAADGFIDLDSDDLYDYIRHTAREYFTLYPQFDELVVTLTETKFPVARRPFCATPVPERLRRVLQAVADVTDPLGKELVIRPFSAVRADELNVREAVQHLRAKHVTLMYKTEPFDWHPFLEDEPLIGSVPGRAARAESDGGAEYYGQGVIPACYTRHIQKRYQAAFGRGATSATLRVDRGARHPALGNPVNEANVVPVTAWLKDPAKSLAPHVQRWLTDTHGCGDPAFADLLEQTFDVIRDCLYIDQQGISHQHFPTLERGKYILLFALFEPGVPVDHLKDVWSVVPGRRTLQHADILTQKRRAVELGRELVRRFEAWKPRLKPASAEAIGAQLPRLVVLAEACEQLCRLIIAHLAGVWRLPNPAAADFDAECRAMLALADRVDREQGYPFFPAFKQKADSMCMTDAMRSFATGLAEERRLEQPQRDTLDADPAVVDYVLCGFASEGHRTCKRVHSGATPAFPDGFGRTTGHGEEEAFAYTLTARRLARRLELTFHRPAKAAVAMVRAADVTRAFEVPAAANEQLTWNGTVELPHAMQGLIQVQVHSAGATPVTVRRMVLR